MADETMLAPPVIPAPTKIRTHAALIQITVQTVDAGGVVVGERFFEINTTDPTLTPLQRSRLVDTVQAIARHVGVIA